MPALNSLDSSNRRVMLFAVALWSAATLGCAHHQLRWDTVKQSKTLTTIFEQQVLDNLAMFVYTPDSLPFFSFPNAGGSNVNDSGSITGSLAWARAAAGFESAGLGLGANRSLEESWTLTPITDPRKLELMRCAYQQAIAPCTGSLVSGDCPNCKRAFQRFYTGNPDEAVPAQDKGAKGVTSECIGTNCWFGFGCKKCVPKGCRCLKVGHHCGVHVWVLPEGQNELSKLTMAILDYAMYQAPNPDTKKVTWFFDANGNPATSDTAARVEEATISFLTTTPMRLPAPRPEERSAAQKQAAKAAEFARQAQAAKAAEAAAPDEPGRQALSMRGVRAQQEAAEAMAAANASYNNAAHEGASVPVAPPQQPVRSWVPNADYLQFQQNLRFLAPGR